MEPKDAYKLRAIALIDPVMVSLEGIQQVRRDYEAGLDELMQKGAYIENPMYEVEQTNVFYLPYHGLNDVVLQSKLAQLYLQASPFLSFTCPHLRNRSSEYSQQEFSDRKIRIAFLSKCFTPEHR